MLAKVLTALVFSLIALVLLIGYGIVVGGIHQTPAVWATIILRLLAGSLPFIALGFAIGYWSGPQRGAGDGELDLPAAVVRLWALRAAQPAS